MHLTLDEQAKIWNMLFTEEISTDETSLKPIEVLFERWVYEADSHLLALDTRHGGTMFALPSSITTAILDALLAHGMPEILLPLARPSIMVNIPLALHIDKTDPEFSLIIPLKNGFDMEELHAIHRYLEVGELEDLTAKDSPTFTEDILMEDVTAIRFYENNVDFTSEAVALARLLKMGNHPYGQQSLICYPSNELLDQYNHHATKLGHQLKCGEGAILRYGAPHAAYYVGKEKTHIPYRFKSEHLTWTHQHMQMVEDHTPTVGMPSMVSISVEFHFGDDSRSTENARLNLQDWMARVADKDPFTDQMAYIAKNY